MRIALTAGVSVLLAAATIRAQPAVDQAALLERLVDLDRLAAAPSPLDGRPRLYASFDRRQTEVVDGKYAHWDGEQDAGQFYGRTDDGWDILVDQDAPGALLHWWIDEPAGDLRIELDGERVFEGAFAALFDGTRPPFEPPLTGFVSKPRGATCSFPVGFAERCRVLTRGFAGRYQIDALAWPAGTRVERFTGRLTGAAKAARERVAATLRSQSDDDFIGGRRTATYAIQQDLAAGGEFAETIDKPGVIRALYVSLTDRVEPRELYALHRCVIRLTWDGADRPAVELPLSTFFGAGFERNTYNSLPMGTDRWLDMPGLFPAESWFMYSLFPMPFESARVEIENRNEKAIGLMLYMRVERATPPPGTLRFYTTFRVEDPCESFDYPLLAARGPGRIVGCVLNVDTPRGAWWGRGDHKVWIDDDRLPSLLGTGTADYFGNVVPPVLTAGAFRGVTLAGAPGKSSLYRWHVGDALAFDGSVRFMLENWQPDGRNDVYYSSTVYWYGPPGADARGMRLSADTLDVHGLRIPGALECEGNIVGSDWGRLYRQRAGAELSGEAGVLITTTEPVAFRLPVERAGRYRVQLRTHPTRSFGTVRVTAGVAGAPLGTIAWRSGAGDLHDVGELDLAAGSNEVTVVCDRPTVLDCWVLTPAGG